ncbi:MULTISPECIES: cupin domain-containing protein [Rhizobium]|uniref:Cupin type-2 domain-containing protein n=1 Tax=Rhizobium rhizogenes (strain K84 / ATCC BAA-868) TaxID=311403 RepID=B9JM34_RHIR8|nr:MULTISPECIES: cupin domain-containing protein [Rhizobium]ACM28748.1 conserved hypothetical protein [Rhizobium rhizogenes K84]EJK88044.1 cupin domain-containing protein [Rhizobium sp. AP16]NTI43740.1 cupin domain-containing protein [Rhizobium rhizogenes]OCJ18987.1 cupin [Agrobacterium sp. B131/95]
MILANEETGTTGHEALRVEDGTVVTLMPQTAGGSRSGSIALVTLARGGVLSSVATARCELALVALAGAARLEVDGKPHVIGPFQCFYIGQAAVTIRASEHFRLLVIAGDLSAADGKAPVAPRMIDIVTAPDHPFHMPEQGFYHLSARWLVDGGIGSDKLVIGQSTFASHDGAHELHRHAHGEEFFFVLEGQGVHLTEDGEYPMAGGDLVFVPCEEWHGFRNTASTPVRALFGFLGVNSLDGAGYELHARTIGMAGGR